MGALTFKATLQKRGPAAAVVLDDEQVSTIGEGAKQRGAGGAAAAKSRIPVRATVNGYTWRTSVARMSGEFLLGLNREVREGASVQAGDVVEVTLELDTEPRQVEVPDALAAALAHDPAAKATFDGLAFTHRKEYARWIAEAKRAETRERRVTKAIDMLHRGDTIS